MTLTTNDKATMWRLAQLGLVCPGCGLPEFLAIDFSHVELEIMATLSSPDTSDVESPESEELVETSLSQENMELGSLEAAVVADEALDAATTV